MRRLVIFEGPDGAGKTTLARAVRDALGDAVLTHHGPYPEVAYGDELAELYMRSVSGTRDVVLDRCWVSEAPYGLAFRGGWDRLGRGWRGALDRCAAGGRVYLCLPPWERVLTNWSRGADEYLDRQAQLASVYRWYHDHRYDMTSLPVTVIDPFDGRDHLGEIINGHG